MVLGLLVAVASLVAESGLEGAQASVIVAHGLSSRGSRVLEHRLSSCARTQLLGGMLRSLSRIKPTSPALAGGFLTTRLPGQSY